MAISAGGVALATTGALLVWSGLANSSPLSTIHGVFSGNPPTLNTPGAAGASTQGADVAAVASTLAASSVPGQTNGSNIVNAAMSFKSDQYSQARRNDSGYSDCSSFVSKALLAAGITPCNWTGGNYPTTVSYHAWSAMKGIPSASQAQAGDILLSFGHIAIVIDQNTAIGQENPAINVQVGSWSSIMALTGTYGIYRVVT
jgi:cell wall-associated NlpC family hydrolase